MGPTSGSTYEGGISPCPNVTELRKQELQKILGLRRQSAIEKGSSSNGESYTSLDIAG